MQAVITVKPALFTEWQRLSINITATPPDRRVRDLDNILKSLLDSIVYAGVIHDDSQFDEIHMFRSEPSKPGSVLLQIKPLEN